MSYIESSKNYTGKELTEVFFTPMLTGPSALDLGVKVLYNMPLPTTIQLWDGRSDILQKYTSGGWSGGACSVKDQKTIKLDRVKAEMGYSASDYFSLVFDNIASSGKVNMDDLSGTELEAAETEIFRRSIAESIRATMWVGDTENGDLDTFDGFFRAIFGSGSENNDELSTYAAQDLQDPETAVLIFDQAFEESDQRLKDMRNSGELVFYVSSDIYFAYEKYLDSKGGDASYTDSVTGRKSLMYHGIPVVDLHITNYVAQSPYPDSYCIFTDRRNLVMAVNTADFPGSEIRMWYNPDEMENRQRAVFMAGCDVVDESLVTTLYGM